ncbi:Cyanovirin-N [Mycena galopus ATCC 62051]|nr:Cyanovirin-N [Mycena galopus ATCC 62051]
MKSALLASVILVLCALSSLGAPVEELTSSTNIKREADSGFVSTCTGTSVDVSDAVLTSTCRTEAGGEITSSIGLDSCIANSNGVLVALSNGDFSASCPGITFIGTSTSATLLGQCDNEAGQLVTSTIDLNTVLTNNNGIMTC